MNADEGEAAAVARCLVRNVVVVEDDLDALEDLAELLSYEGFCVIACPDAEQALVALATTPQATLVTDIMLPGIDGIALAHEAMLLFPQIRVVIMSGSDPTHGNGYDPAWAYLQKPFNVDDLIGAILRS